MKRLLTILLSTAILGANAQTHLPVNPLGWGYGLGAWQPFMSVPSFDNSLTKSKWQLRPFASMSAGYVFFNGGISYLSAPVGIAIYHPLNTNWTAFGAATVAPVIFNVNRLSTLPINDPNHYGYPFSGESGLGLTTGIQGGLIYTNDAKTFSISGSVQIERSSYPVYPSYKTAPTKQ
jgi:hypothetical protein